MGKASITASLLLFFLFIVGMTGMFSYKLAWMFLVLSWWMGMVACSAWYMSRRDHNWHWLEALHRKHYL